MTLNHSAFAGAAFEQIESEIAQWVASNQAALLNDEEVFGTIAIAIGTVPHTLTGTVARLAAEKIEHSHLGNPVARQTMASILRGIVDGLDAFKRDHCGTPEACRAELIRRLREKKATVPGIAFRESPKPPPAPPDILSIIGAYPDESQNFIYALYGILRKELRFGVDIASEIEGDAAEGVAGLFEAINKAPIETASIVRRVMPDAQAPLKAYRDWQMRRTPEAQAADSIKAEREMRSAMVQLVRVSMPLIDALLLGYASRHPTPAVLNTVKDWGDQLNVLAGTSPSGMREKLARVREIAEEVADVTLKVTAMAILWAGLMLVLAWSRPDWTFEATGGSFIALLIGTWIAVFFKGTRKETLPDGRVAIVESNATVRRVAAVIFSGVIGMLGAAYGFFIATFVDTLPVPPELAEYDKLVPLTEFHYVAAVLCMVALILWNHVSLAGMQETVHGIGATKRLVKTWIKEEGEATVLIESLKKNVFFSKLGYTILGAVGAIIFVPFVTWLIGLGPVARGIVTFIGVLLAITTSNIGSHIMTKWGLGETVKKGADKDYSRVANLRFVVPGVFIALFAVVALFGVSWAIGLRERASHIGSKAVEQIDEATGYSGASSTTSGTTTTSTTGGGGKSCETLRPASRTVMCQKYGKCCQ